MATGSSNAMRMQCDTMLCSEMQSIYSVTPGTQYGGNDPGHAPPRVSSKAGKLRSVASAEDATLSNMRTRGSNPKYVMFV